jgi:hypothetical protein
MWKPREWSVSVLGHRTAQQSRPTTIRDYGIQGCYHGGCKRSNLVTCAKGPLGLPKEGGVMMRTSERAPLTAYQPGTP